jgi:cysteine desulfurase
MDKTIYLDHASTTYMDEKVLEEMKPYFNGSYGNPSSLHSVGQKARISLDKARETVAENLNCSGTEITFTGGGTESVNLAIFGVAREKGKGHIITSKIEHKAVLKSCESLKEQGFEISYVEVDEYGMVNPKDIEKAIRKDTILISVMYANNEIGTVQPIEEIAKIAKKHSILFHTDACQAPGLLEIDTKKLGVDMMTINGSKMYGPKGVGVLFHKTGIKLKPLIHGGGQEENLRSGTENIPGVVGLAKALELAEKNRLKETKRLWKLNDKLKEEVFKKIPKVILNGHPEKRLANNLNISFLDIEGESIMLYLDKHGVCISTGSACTSDSFEPSHVLTSTGLIHGAAHGSIRFSFGKCNTEKDIEYIMSVLPEIIEKLRAMSPLNLDPNKIRK